MGTKVSSFKKDTHIPRQKEYRRTQSDSSLWKSLSEKAHGPMKNSLRQIGPHRCDQSVDAQHSCHDLTTAAWRPTGHFCHVRNGSPNPNQVVFIHLKYTNQWFVHSFYIILSTLESISRNSWLLRSQTTGMIDFIIISGRMTWLQLGRRAELSDGWRPKLQQKVKWSIWWCWCFI